MKISVYQINELRKITGVGVMDCRKALIDSNGNIDEAILLLRKKGEKIAINRSSFQMKEGGVLSNISSDSSYGTIIGISCETDFLSKSSEFLNFLSMLSKKSLSYHTKDDFLNSFCHENNSVQEMIIRKMGVVGEKLELKIFERIESPFVIDYTHNNYKIATLVGFSSELNISVARNIAMHITAMNPIAVNEEQIPDVVMKKEIDIIKNQVKKEIKSCDMIKKIIQGKIQKFILNNTLMNQKFIKDNKINIREYLSKYYNKNLKINLFKRVGI
ncbi:translation elongation factor EF-Ts [Blattabacterium sp. (Blattella germanica) str. Bge]|uniref:translation elongation factor Ts n=1 Tax=Blattabacterium sp. (Blattella germanica) TaxID=624186 RepID=UPI0001BB6131|nr:translation elongation factor Ts [Blattabacterium sp. (Blattella germanica)]ACY40251.1 translation elongation factor EF-Ts [Blattabacterium sp. (Blattella germanica) str. Bge]